jgi:hypothetical protein
LSSCLLSKNLKIKTYNTIILSLILYGCETWSLTLREEHGLGMLESRVLRVIFGPKREEVVRCWRRLHNEEFNNLYISTHIIRVISSSRMRWVGHVAHMKDIKNAYIVLVRKPERKRPLGRLRCRWEDNIRNDFRGTEREGVDWIHLA